MANKRIGSRKSRIQKALRWYWTRDLTQEEIAEKLGVSQGKVSEYLNEAPTSDAVQEQLDKREAEVRYVATETLRQQLKEAGERAKTAEKPVKVWENDNGELVVNDERDDAGNVTGRYPVPQDFEMGADDQERFYGRNEVREILDLLTDIVGAKAAERHKHEHSGEDGGPIEISITETVVETDHGGATVDDSETSSQH